MNRVFLGWHWDEIDIDSKRGAWFVDDSGQFYVCHYIEDLPCPKCKPEPVVLRSSEYYQGWRDAIALIKGETE